MIFPKLALYSAVPGVPGQVANPATRPNNTLVMLEASEARQSLPSRLSLIVINVEDADILLSWMTKQV